jgi:hypothetical protein
MGGARPGWKVEEVDLAGDGSCKRDAVPPFRKSLSCKIKKTPTEGIKNTLKKKHNHSHPKSQAGSSLYLLRLLVVESLDIFNQQQQQQLEVEETLFSKYPISRVSASEF